MSTDFKIVQWHQDIYATYTFPIMHLICPPKFGITSVFLFLLGITAVPREIEPWFSHTFSVIILQNQNYRKCMEKLRFSKNWLRMSLHSRFSVLFLWTRKLLVLRESIKDMNSGELAGFEFQYKSSNSPAILPWLPMIQLWAWTPLFNISTSCTTHLDILKSRQLKILPSKKWTTRQVDTFHGLQ